MSCACSGNGCAAVLSQTGQDQILALIASNASWNLHLFGGTTLGGPEVDGDHTPCCCDTLATYTGPSWELAYTGYVPQTLVLNAPAVVACSNYGITANQLTFTNGVDAGPIYVFGYFVTDSTNTYLIYAQRLAPPQPQVPYQTLLLGSKVKISAQLIFCGCGCSDGC